jgi:divalent metal cation (Fe/Co/Zn/Cd) transporter
VHAGTRSSKIDGHDHAHHHPGVAVAALAGAIVLATGLRAADGLAALLVAFPMVRSGRGPLRDAARARLGGSAARRRA